MRRSALVSLLLLAACAPAHLGTLPATGARELPDLFLGGWDGKRLGLYDDATIEPGVTTREELVRALGRLSGSNGLVWIERDRLDDAFARRHGVFCETALCLVVLDRRDRGGALEAWGTALAIFELGGPENDVLGRAWIAGRMVRPPGPTRWPLHCRRKDETPRHLHPDGGALFPERSVGAEPFALFGAGALAAEYRAGFVAPSETLCDEDAVRALSEPAPERPEIKADPRLLGIEAQ